MFPRLTRDGWLLFATRATRMFAYGFLSVVLVLYLRASGVSDEQVGILLTMTLIGDVGISLWITTSADRAGRARMLLVGALLMVLVGTVFSVTNSYPLLLIVATIGVLSPSDKEVGPFLSIEQSSLAQTISDDARTGVFAWYNLVGSVCAALGALAGGAMCQLRLQQGAEGAEIYRPVVIGYAALGMLLVISFPRLSRRIEVDAASRRPGADSLFGLHSSWPVVLRLSALFSLDAFGGGFLLQSMVANWFSVRFGLSPGALGAVFFTSNLLAAASSLAAAAIAKKIGLINTMVFTHLPSNVMLLMVPWMPNAPLAVGLFLLRSCISQMDVPTRQSYTMAVVHPDERSAASGVTTVARSIGAAVAPTIAGFLMARPAWVNAPIWIAAVVKIAYDLLLYRAFVTRPEAVETGRAK